jgi:hypothetical protein
MYVAETEVGSDFLGHMRWVAAGLGFAVEPVASSAVAGEGGTIYRLRDALMLVDSVEPMLETWLDRLGVRRLPARDATLSLSRAGTAVIGHGDGHLECETVVLADDAAILAHLSEAERQRMLRAVPHTSVVTQPAGRPLAAPLISYIDRGLTLRQGPGRGPISAVAAGMADEALPRIASSLARQGRLRRTGQTSFQSVATADGAPLVARLGKGRALVTAGLGASAAFLAPVLARLVAETALADEVSYFSARGPSATGDRRSVAELPVPELRA